VLRICLGSACDKTVKVRVKAPYRVVHPDYGEPFSDGDELTVPESTAAQWQRLGFVEQVTREK